ncbi:hypothetical protein MHF_1472 [Mycoplasma haemofelis Ohio2]|uniref:Uncharacterized protein n=1 Tax=Mycoplasma haemofelis (strain Ohio2) TaxID=859194 RepID=F6FGZ7_MYCHI|nr:hypothetical protein MHF_1472 [Mycoplasma haemofelis Ohio2]
MNSFAGKGLLASIPVAGAAGTGAYFGFTKSSNSAETIQSKLEKEFEGKKRKVLVSSLDAIWEKYKALYKKKFGNTKGIEETAIPSWCEATLKKEYSEKESSIYSKASELCVVNINTLKAELEGEGLKFLSFEASADSKWQTAWTKYNSDKGDLEVTVLKDSSVNSSTSGGPKLKEWCKAKLEKHMYEDLEEDRALDKVKKYCVEGRGT